MPQTKIYSRVATDSLEDRQALLVGGIDSPGQDDPVATGVFLADEDGVSINPQTSETDPIVGITIEDAPVEVFTIEHGAWFFNEETDVRIYVGFSENLTVDNGAIVVEPDSQAYFAPPRDAAYRGPAYIIAADGSAGRKLRIQPW